MKRILLISALIVGLIATFSFAQMTHEGMMGSGSSMMGSQSQQQTGEATQAGWQYPCPQMMGYGSGMMGGMMRHMGSGYGGHMMGGMMGSGMMGYGYTKENQKFLDETADLRKELHNKKFEHFEVLRNPDVKPETVIELETEIRELQIKIYRKSLK